MAGRVRIELDEARCVGHGRCYVLGPDVFGEDEMGHCVVRAPEVDGALADQARLGAQNCPEEAITIREVESA